MTEYIKLIIMNWRRCSGDGGGRLKKTERERGSDVSWGENYYVRVYYVPLFDGRSGHGFLTEIRMYMYSDRQKWYKNRRERQKNAKKTGGEKKRERERESADGG